MIVRRALILVIFLVGSTVTAMPAQGQESRRGAAVSRPVGGVPAPSTTDPTSQPVSQPATQPTTASAPAEVPNPLGSPARLIQYFRAAVDEGRTQDALACLNFPRVDAEVAKEQGADYFAQLAAILKRLAGGGHFDADKLPDDPTAPPQTIGKDPLLPVLERYEIEKDKGKERRWQFSATTVADIPALHDTLEALLTQVEGKTTTLAAERAPAEEQVKERPADDPLRSPCHMVQYFLIAVANAKKDSAAHADAMACLDFSLVRTEEIGARTEYADSLNIILEHLHARGDFDREQLPRETEPGTETLTIGRDPLQIILGRRQTPGRRFQRC